MTQNRLMELTLRAMFRTASREEMTELAKEMVTNRRNCIRVILWRAKLIALSRTAVGDRTRD